MKKSILALFLASATISSLYADDAPLASGYYRVKNYKTNRYVYVYDNTGKINAAAGSADVGALDLWKDLNRAISDPGSVLYANYIGSNGKGGYSYDVEAQGTGVHEIIGYFVSIYRKSNGHLNIYASLGGFTKYLDDEETNLSLAQGQMGFNRTGDFQLWDEYPIDANSDNYFGVAPTLSANGKFYQPFYAAFPFNFASSGMKAYYVKVYDAAEGIAVISELTGDVPGSTPIIVECSSEEPTNNRLNLLRNSNQPVDGNQLAGVYFNNPYREDSQDAQTRYDAETMRVLGTDAEGKLVFKKYNKTYLPANQSYLVVPAGAPETVTIMTEEEYNARVISVASLSLNETALSLVEGDSFQLTAEVAPANATDRTLTWSSSDVNVITVDQTGLVLAVAPGSAVVTVKANDGSNVEASCSVTVEQKIVLVSSIVLNETTVTIKEGETFQLTASVLPANATDASFLWASSDATLATVDATGLVQALLAGEVVITASANDASGVSASCNVKIEQEAGITAVLADGACATDIFTLSGVKVRMAGDNIAGLVPGIYVVGGKKIIIY